MLIYITSLALQSTIDMTIDNQSSNIELASPVYFIKDTACHIHFPQQVNSKSIMNAKFVTGVNQDTFGGALLYHLQGKMDASISAQLLVIWGCNSDRFYSHARLIDHESTIVWDKTKLKRLYDGYDSQYEASYNVKQENWLLNDKIELKIESRLKYRHFEINIIISEEKDMLYFMFPLKIDSNR
jgi:hypothetical protein